MIPNTDPTLHVNLAHDFVSELLQVIAWDEKGRPLVALDGGKALVDATTLKNYRGFKRDLDHQQISLSGIRGSLHDLVDLLNGLPMALGEHLPTPAEAHCVDCCEAHMGTLINEQGKPEAGTK